MDCNLPGSSVHGISQARILEWVAISCHFLLQGIFPTQGSNPCFLCLLLWQVGSLPTEPAGRAPKGFLNLYHLFITHDCSLTTFSYFFFKNLSSTLYYNLHENKEHSLMLILSFPVPIICLVHNRSSVHIYWVNKWHTGKNNEKISSI